MAYSTTSCVALTIAGLCAVWLFSGLRFYVRVGILRHFYLDDFFVSLALICYTIIACFFLDGTLVYSLGEHASQVQDPVKISNGMKDLFFAEIFYYLGNGFVKLSFALTLLRIVVLRFHVVVLYTTLALTTIVTMSTFIFSFLMCKPLSYYWEAVLDPTGGSCVSNIQIKNSYAYAAVMLFADMVLGILVPLHLLIGLQMQRNVKITAGILLSLGSVASIATIARVIYTIRINPLDVYYSAKVPYLWGEIELSTSIIGVSAATLKPLLIHLRILKGSGYTSYATDYELHGSRLASNNRNIVTISNPGGRGDQASSTDEITWDGKDGPTLAIHRTVQFETSTGTNSEWME